MVKWVVVGWCCRWSLNCEVCGWALAGKWVVIGWYCGCSWNEVARFLMVQEVDVNVLVEGAWVAYRMGFGWWVMDGMVKRSGWFYHRSIRALQCASLGMLFTLPRSRLKNIF